MNMYNKNQVFAAACLGMLLFGIVFLSLGSVNNMLAERFALDDNEIGTLTALLPFGILCGSLIFGPIVDQFGHRGMLVVASLVVGASLEGMAFATDRAFVKLCVFAIGFGGGVLNGATNALAVDVSQGERGQKLSLLGVFFGIGALAMPATIASLSHIYSLSTIVAGIGTLVVVPIAYCMVIEFPPPKQRDVALNPAVGFALLADPFFLFACLACAVQSGMEGLSNDWMTRYFKNVVLGPQGKEQHAQFALVGLTAGMVFTRLALSSLLKNISSRLVLFASVALTTCGAFVMAATTDFEDSVLAAVLIGCGLAAVFPVVLGYVGDRFPTFSGTAFSTVFVSALIGYIIVNKSFGYIAHKYDIAQYPKVMLVLLAASFVLLHLVCKLFARPLR